MQGDLRVPCDEKVEADLGFHVMKRFQVISGFHVMKRLKLTQGSM